MHNRICEQTDLTGFFVRHGGYGQNPHSSGIFTFFSLEEGSNFVQKPRPQLETTAAAIATVVFAFLTAVRSLRAI